MNKNRIQILLLIGIALLLLGAAFLFIRGGAGASAQEGTAVAVATSPLLQYQGRLSDPSSGEAVVDGDYTMTFRLYTAPSGGPTLWSEVKDVQVRQGLFSTLLGDISPLKQGVFNGQPLWLGIKVGSDAEAAPRQQILPVAYALSLVPGASIQADSSAAALSVGNAGSGPALAVAGDLAVTGSLNGGEHTHAGADISSGKVADGRIAGTIARDAEVTNAIGGHAAKANAHHARYTDAEAASAALSHPEIVTQYEFEDHIYGGMHNGRAIAYGVINQEGGVAAATGNVTSEWNSVGKYFEITIDGHSYDHWSYVTVVTPITYGDPAVFSSDGKLIVSIWDESQNSSTNQPFQFVTFQP